VADTCGSGAGGSGSVLGETASIVFGGRLSTLRTFSARVLRVSGVAIASHEATSRLVAGWLAASSAEAMASAVGYRLAGSAAQARRTTSSSAGGRSGTSSEGSP
jgi:hypothetical protein